MSNIDILESNHVDFCETANDSRIYRVQKAADSTSRVSVAEEKRFLVSCMPTNAVVEARKLWSGIMKKGTNFVDVSAKMQQRTNLRTTTMYSGRINEFQRCSRIGMKPKY